VSSDPESPVPVTVGPGVAPQEAASSTPADEAKAPPSRWRWLAVVVLAALVISTMAPSLPAGWKRLGLLYAAVGAAIGGIGGWMAVREGFRRPRRGIWFVLLLTLLALFNATYLSFRAHRAEVQAAARQDKERQALMKLIESVDANDPAGAPYIEAFRRQVSPELRDYLAFRYSNVVDRPSPVPELLWGIEVILGLLSSGLAYRAAVKNFSPSPVLPSSLPPAP